MKFVLTRNSYEESGVFGTLTSEDGGFSCVTLEHSYNVNPADQTENWQPKVAAGTYACLRHPPNRLPYETFELQDVADFEGQPVTGILIHKGNYDKDSEGCILLGDQVIEIGQNQKMITSSAPTFNKFMALLSGLDEFTLTIA